MSDVTRILAQIDSGDPAAAEQLLPLVYDELRKLAAAKLAHEQPGQTLQATALVHEAYLRLVRPGVGENRLLPTPDFRPPTPGFRYFGGLTIEQAAEVLKTSRVTAHRYWTVARGWLHQEITGEQRTPAESAG